MMINVALTQHVMLLTVLLILSVTLVSAQDHHDSQNTAFQVYVENNEGSHATIQHFTSEYMTRNGKKLSRRLQNYRQKSGLTKGIRSQRHGRQLEESSKGSKGSKASNKGQGSLNVDAAFVYEADFGAIFSASRLAVRDGKVVQYTTSNGVGICSDEICNGSVTAVVEGEISSDSEEPRLSVFLSGSTDSLWRIVCPSITQTAILARQDCTCVGSDVESETCAFVNDEMSSSTSDSIRLAVDNVDCMNGVMGPVTIRCSSSEA